MRSDPSGGASWKSQSLRPATMEAARETVRYMLARGRSSGGEARPSPTAPASGRASEMVLYYSSLRGDGRGTPRAPLFKVPPCGVLGGKLLAALYRAWWSENLPTPYGLCACGCGRRTPRAGWTSRQRGFVSGEPLAFLAHHRKRYGYPALTDPGRRCACGCGGRTPVVRDTATEEAGVPYQFAGMRAKYLNAHHRPPPALPYLTLGTPLGTPLGDPQRATEEYGLAHEERIWLAEVADAHLSFARDRGKLRPKLQSTDQRTIKRFLLSSGRGRVDTSQPQRRGASPVYKWSGRSPLETANVLTRLHALLGSRSREQAREFLKEMGFSYHYEDRDEGVRRGSRFARHL